MSFGDMKSESSGRDESRKTSHQETRGDDQNSSNSASGEEDPKDSVWEDIFRELDHIDDMLKWVIE